MPPLKKVPHALAQGTKVLFYQPAAIDASISVASFLTSSGLFFNGTLKDSRRELLIISTCVYPRFSVLFATNPKCFIMILEFGYSE
ncbi:MAG: hypothetical protein RR355_02355, partial [Oscillospiraceae bacterium]